MSRRKQHKPRHFDSVPGEEGELLGPVVAGGGGHELTAGPDDSRASSPCSSDVRPDSLVDDPYHSPHHGSDIDLPGAHMEQDDPHVTPECDAPRTVNHICKVCCAEFYQLADFVEHGKLCGNPEVLCYPSNSHRPQSPKSDSSGPAEHRNPELDDLHKDAMRQLQILSQGGTGIGYSTAIRSEDDMERKISEQHYPESEEMSDKPHRRFSEDNLAAEEGYEDEEEGDEDMMGEDGYEDYDDYDEDDGIPDEALALPPAGVFPGQFPPGLSPQVQLSMMQASCNVKLQSLENTKVAVAQFAENNINPSDIASLQSTLYGLQQQQMFQLQLLQQIQQQILTAGLQSLPPATIQALSSGMLPAALPNMAAMAQLALSQKAAASTSDAAKSSSSGPTSGLPLDGGKPSESKDPRDKVKSPANSSTATTTSSTSTAMSTAMSDLVTAATASSNRQPRTSPQASEASSRPIAKSSVAPSSHGLPTIPPLSAIGAPIFSTVVPEMSQLSSMDRGDSSGNNLGGTCLDRSQYAADDPFFKHKCRFCHKVFGSDSALQIHIRSHTGERPFKCNVCGNRFSTKGNLKVHFQRHKEQYPHLEMDGNPFPEMLDGAPPPLLMSTPRTGMGLRPPLLPPTSIPPPLVPMAPSLPTPGRDREARDELNKTPRKQEPSGEHLRPGASPMERLCAMPMPSMKAFEEKLNASVTSTKVKDEQEKVTKSESGEKKEDPSRSASVTSEKSLASRTPAATPTSSLASTQPQLPPRGIHPGFMSPLGPGTFPGHGPLSGPSSLAGPIINFPFPGINSHPGLSPIPPPHFGFDSPFSPRPSILPNRSEDPMDQYMECQKSETSKLEALVKNIETKLTDPNQCAICHRILSCKSALQMHYRTHTGERPFRCRICSRAFTTKGNLKTHMGVHRAKPPLRMMHQCPVCHKQFTNALVLQQHIRMHTGEVPKEMAIHGHDVMLANPMPYMPFPGFPFFPPSMPPPHPCPGVELDLRKPSKISPGSLQPKQHKSGEERDQDDKGSLLQHSGEHSSDEDHGSMEQANGLMDRMPSDDDDFGEPERSMALESRGRDIPSDIDDSPGSRDVKFSGSDQSDPDMKIGREKSPFCHMTSTPQPLKKRRCESPSSRPIMDFGQYEHFSSERYPPTSSYSTSLMALEDHVKGINSMESNQFGMRPLEHMENIVKHADGHITPPMSLQVPGSDSKSLSPSMPRLSRLAHEGHSPSPGKRSPAFSDGHGSHSCDRLNSNLSSSPSAPRFPEFGPMNLSSTDFENATGKPHTTCDICFKTFACRSALDIHYRSHTKERPYVCEFCDRSFSTRGNMKQHMLIHKSGDLHDSINSCSNHSSSSDYKVDITPPASVAPPMTQPPTPVHTSQPSKVETSTSNKPPVSQSSSSPFVRQPSLKHVCHVCNKPFSSASALQIHMRTHTGDKPFKCNVCGKAFTTKGNLKVHMGTHMWNNGPSRRGRRMSVEGIPGLQMPPRDAEFFKAFAHRPPVDLFPFPYPGFPNGFGPKMNEISVIQTMNGSMSQLPPTSAAESMMSHIAMMKGGSPNLKSDFRYKETLLKAEAILKAEEGLKKNDMKVKSETNNNSYPVLGSSGELDLSVRKPQKSVTPPPVREVKAEPTTPKHRPPSSELSPSSNPWLWKTTCHLCNHVCSSQGALEAHMKSHMARAAEESAPKPVMT